MQPKLFEVFAALINAGASETVKDIEGASAASPLAALTRNMQYHFLIIARIAYI
jgi:hypothetical protein